MKIKHDQKSQMTRNVRLIGHGILLVFISLVLTSTSGCTSTRKVMYMGDKRVGDYIAKTGGQAARDNITLWKVRKANLEKFPDGNRLFGGFCTDKKVKASLEKLRELKNYCVRRTTDDTEKANLQGRLFWGFLTASIVTGTGMIVGGLAPTDDAVKGWMAFSFGAATFTLSMINGLGGFDGRETVLSMRAKKLDNLMWTLRLRFIAEACNAKDLATARQQAKQIARMTRRICITNYKDDGLYRIPTRSRKQ